MAKHVKYLLTVESETGAPVKIELMGEAGELTEVPLEDLQIGRGMHSTPQVVNVFFGSQPGAAVQVQRAGRQPPQPPSIIIGGPTPPPKPRPKPADEDDED